MKYLKPSSPPTPESSAPVTVDDGNGTGMSEQKIATVLGIRRSQVETIIRHALNKLRRRSDRLAGFVACVEEKRRIAEERKATRSFSELAMARRNSPLDRR